MALMSEPSAVEPDTRIDLFITFHGSEQLNQNFTTRELAQATEQAVWRHARKHGAEPSIFFDGTAVRSEIAVVFDAILQTRSGGVALFLLTAQFFQSPWCVAELRAFLEVRAGSHIKFRFVCLERTPERILASELVHRLVPEFVRDFSLQTDFTVSNLSDTSGRLAELVWSAWTCTDGDISRNHLPTILGRLRNDSFLMLPQYFTEDDLPTLRAIFDLPKDKTSVVFDAFALARERRIIHEHDVKRLYRVITLRSAPTATTQNNAVEAYERKWVHSHRLEWGAEIQRRLSRHYNDSKYDIRRIMASLSEDVQYADNGKGARIVVMAQSRIPSVPSGLKLTAIEAPNSLESSSGYPVLQAEGITYWPLSYMDNREMMAIVAFRANGQVGRIFERHGARYIWKIEFEASSDNVLFIGQGRSQIRMAMHKLTEF